MTQNRAKKGSDNAKWGEKHVKYIDLGGFWGDLGT